MDYIFLIVAVFLAFRAWNTPFWWVAFALVGDFCAHIGFDAYMLSPEFISMSGYDVMYAMFMPLKATVSMAFFIIFLATATANNSSQSVSLILAALSVISGMFHIALGVIEYNGLYFNHYGLVMSIYCILQLSILGGGMAYGHVHRIGAYLHRWGNRWLHH